MCIAWLGEVARTECVEQIPIRFTFYDEVSEKTKWTFNVIIANRAK